MLDALEATRDLPFVRLEYPVEGQKEHVVFVPEILVDQSGADSRLRGDLLNGGDVVTFFRKQFDGRFEDLPAPLFHQLGIGDHALDMSWRLHSLAPVNRASSISTTLERKSNFLHSFR